VAALSSAINPFVGSVIAARFRSAGGRQDTASLTQTRTADAISP
jgi:hypothetical protein